MRWLLDEQYEEIIQRTKEVERNRCIEIVGNHRNDCADPEHRDSINSIIDEIRDAKS